MIKTYINIILITVLPACLSITEANAQTNESAYKGRHFFLGFMQNEVDGSIMLTGALALRIHITAEQDANILVNTPLYSTLHTISADSILILDIYDGMELKESEEIVNRLVEIESDVPIMVYCYNSRHQTTDSYAAIPVSKWGYEYVTVNYSNDQYFPDDEEIRDYLLEPRSSEFLIMAAYDSTVVEIIPASITRANKQYGKKYYVTLNEGEAYLVQSYRADKGYGDLTGSIIRSTKPIGVISGHVRTSIPNTINIDSKDHLCEMLMPAETWGKKFISVPFGVNTVGDLFRITGYYPNTIVSFRSQSNQGSTEIDNPGGFKELINAFEPIVWESNRPVQIAQFMKRFGGPNDPQNYDPCMVILPPVEQFVNRILFQVPNYYIATYTIQFDHHVVSLVATEEALSNLTIDGALVSVKDNIENQKIPGENLYWARFEAAPGKHELKCEKGGFMAILYGYGHMDSYAHVLGASLENPNAKDSIAPEIFISENCGKINGYIREWFQFGNKGIDFAEVVESKTSNYKWTLDPVTDTSTFIYFTAEPEDIFSDGSFALDYRDRAGNGGRYFYEYNGIKLDIPEEVVFKDSPADGTVCNTFSVVNRGSGTVTVNRFNFLNRPNSSYKCNETFPKELAPGDSFEVEICYIPGGDTASLDTRIDVNVRCLGDTLIPVKGSVELPKIIITDYDFYRVLVGRDSCADVYIINAGTLPVTIDSLKLPTDMRFSFEGGINFPVKFYSGDSLKIRFCFNPDSIGIFEGSVSTYNNRGLTSEGKLTGEGAYQDVNSITIDWKKRRAGTVNDTTAEFSNSGTYKAFLSFDEFLNYDTDISADRISKIKDILLFLANTKKIDLSFTPHEARKYELSAKMKTGWELHPSISVNLLGEGTLPEIETRDLVLDTTVIYTRRDSNCRIITAGGNEDLTIDAVNFIEGDDSCFVIDLSTYTDITLPAGDFIEIPVTFIPQKLGWSEIVLEVIHDAMPAYRRDTAYISIKGFAVPEDTLDAEMDLEMPAMLTCVKEKIYPEIINTGNTAFELRESPEIFSAGGMTAEIVTEPSYPYYLAPDSALTYTVELLPYGREQKILEIKQTAYGINGEEKALNVSRTFTPVIMPLEINPIEDLSAAPGDTIRVFLSGSFPHRADTAVSFNIELSMQMSSFYYVKEPAELNLNTNGNNLTYPLDISQESNKLLISLKEKLSLSENAQWELDFKLLALLSGNHDESVTCRFYSDLCYLPGSIGADVDIKDVCAQNLRIVNTIQDRPWLYVSPSPVREKMNVKLFLPEKDKVNLSLFDLQGKKYVLLSNYFLKKGEHSLIFEKLNFEPGLYFISMTANKNIVSQKLIISK